MRVLLASCYHATGYTLHMVNISLAAVQDTSSAMHLLRSARKASPAQPRLPAASITEEPIEDLAEEQRRVAADVAVPGVPEEDKDLAQSPAQVAAAEHSGPEAGEHIQTELSPGHSAAAAKVRASTSSGVDLPLKGALPAVDYC